MPRKPKRKLTSVERRAKRERRRKYMTIFINGKQKRIPRPPTIDGPPVEEFIRRNADPIGLHQSEMWEYIDWHEEVDSSNGDGSPSTDLLQQSRTILDSSLLESWNRGKGKIKLTTSQRSCYLGCHRLVATSRIHG